MLGSSGRGAGIPACWAPLDEAWQLAEPTGELPRIGAAATARARQPGWKAGTRPSRTRRTRRSSFDRESAIALIGELACWRRRAGIRDDIRIEAAEPYAAESRRRLGGRGRLLGRGRLPLPSRARPGRSRRRGAAPPGAGGADISALSRRPRSSPAACASAGPGPATRAALVDAAKPTRPDPPRAGGAQTRGCRLQNNQMPTGTCSPSGRSTTTSRRSSANWARVAAPRRARKPSASASPTRTGSRSVDRPRLPDRQTAWRRAAFARAARRQRGSGRGKHRRDVGEQKPRSVGGRRDLKGQLLVGIAGDEVGTTSTAAVCCRCAAMPWPPS